MQMVYEWLEAQQPSLPEDVTAVMADNARCRCLSSQHCCVLRAVVSKLWNVTTDSLVIANLSLDVV